MENKSKSKKIKKILVTGCEGFIATHLIKKLKKLDFDVFGCDLEYKEEDEYLKKLITARLNYSKIDKEKDDYADLIIHLGALTGVRKSATKPHEYIQKNIAGMCEILEVARNFKIKNIIYASSSSVYGNGDMKPKSIYAMTKKACEDMAQIYWDQFKIKSVGLRFFTVYGPYGRPDMAVYKFARNIMQGKPIEVYNKNKELYRAFTYIDDIVDGIIGVVNNINKLNRSIVCDMGNDDSRPLSTLIELLEKEIGKKAIIKYKSKPKCDVDETHANNIQAQELFGYYPKVTLETGIKKFIKWLKKYEQQQM